MPEEKKVGISRWGASEVSPDRLQLGNVHGGVVVNSVLESQLHICLGKMFSFWEMVIYPDWKNGTMFTLTGTAVT